MKRFSNWCVVLSVVLLMFAMSSTAFGKVLYSANIKSNADIADWKSVESGILTVGTWEVVSSGDEEDIGAVAELALKDSILVDESFTLPSTFKVSAKIKVCETRWAGIVLNYQDPSHFYVVRIKGGDKSVQAIRGTPDSWAQVANYWTINVPMDTPAGFMIRTTGAANGKPRRSTLLH
jgi:hypothetical protein